MENVLLRNFLRNYFLLNKQKLWNFRIHACFMSKNFLPNITDIFQRFIFLPGLFSVEINKSFWNLSILWFLAAFTFCIVPSLLGRIVNLGFLSPDWLLGSFRRWLKKKVIFWILCHYSSGSFNCLSKKKKKVLFLSFPIRKRRKVRMKILPWFTLIVALGRRMLISKIGLLLIYNWICFLLFENKN